MNTPPIQVHVEDASGAAGVPSTADFVRWAQAALAGRRSEGELAIRVVDEAESAELNGRYRKKSGATNVLSFPAELPRGVPPLAIGDLVICAPVVRREAQEQGKPLDVHWAHMVVHGCLHLLGFDHEDEAAAAEMEPLETDILRQMGYPDPYALR
ncbi:MAG TPA: rRNA maturation RNase YbeY [Gammaproteobacteria bacterium]|nr:rRNA maturation RNase YbeY [Gammaproteobacteria bacterium]